MLKRGAAAVELLGGLAGRGQVCSISVSGQHKYAQGWRQERGGGQHLVEMITWIILICRSTMYSSKLELTACCCRCCWAAAAAQRCRARAQPCTVRRHPLVALHLWYLCGASGLRAAALVAPQRGMVAQGVAAAAHPPIAGADKLTKHAAYMGCIASCCVLQPPPSVPILSASLASNLLLPPPNTLSHRRPTAIADTPAPPRLRRPNSDSVVISGAGSPAPAMHTAAATLKPCVTGAIARRPASRRAVVVRAAHEQEEAVSRRRALGTASGPASSSWHLLELLKGRGPVQGGQHLDRVCHRRPDGIAPRLLSSRSALSGLVALPMLLAAAPAFAFGKDVRKAMQE